MIALNNIDIKNTLTMTIGLTHPAYHVTGKRGILIGIPEVREINLLVSLKSDRVHLMRGVMSVREGGLRDEMIMSMFMS